MRQWFTVFANNVRLGRVHATHEEIARACGPWHAIDRGIVTIFAAPRLVYPSLNHAPRPEKPSAHR